MKTISQRELTHPTKILDLVQQGEEFVVTRNGVPVAKLSPIPSDRTELLRQLVESHQLSPPKEPRPLKMRRVQAGTPLDELMDWMRT